MAPKKILDFLKKNRVPHQMTSHRTVFTAFDAAATQHVKVDTVVKVLALLLDKQPALALIPGNKRLDFAAVKKAVSADRKKQSAKLVSKVSFLKEKQMVKLFELKMKGKYLAAPVLPFGSLYNVPTILDNALLKPKKISLPAGSYQDSVEIAPKHYIKLEKPLVAKISAKK